MQMQIRDFCAILISVLFPFVVESFCDAIKRRLNSIFMIYSFTNSLQFVIALAIRLQKVPRRVVQWQSIDSIMSRVIKMKVNRFATAAKKKC
jgi:hypothetical protein